MCSVACRDLKLKGELPCIGVSDIETMNALLALDEDNLLASMTLLIRLNILHRVREAIACCDIDFLIQEVMLLIHPH